VSGPTLDLVDSDDGTDVAGDYAALFAGQFGAMTRLATLLGADDPEDVAQEAFVRLHRRSRMLRDPHAGLFTTVVRR
jgi:DNA-directed RNA polymerase specialized sigma24 family protein